MAAEKSQLSEKAARYIETLSQARCEGRWGDIAELARKVEKHSGRKCLAQAARTQASQEQRITSRGSGPPSIPVEPLLATIEDPSGTKEDHYQARVCVQWMHWVDGNYDQALQAVPPETVPPDNLEKNGPLAGWTYVCLVQGAFVKGACYEAVGKTKEAAKTYRDAAAKLIGPSSVPVKETQQYKFWSERLLNRFCRIIEPSAESPNVSGDDMTSTLEAFRAWSKASQRDVGESGFTAGGLALEDNMARRTTWLSYYKLLSSMVSKLSGTPGHLSVPVGDVALPSKLELCNEVQHVESTYERVLLREVSFPQASEFNSEVEDWINQAVVNWAAFTGPAWGTSDVPQPGKRELSKKMLDSLYRASKKTFQSMSVLRHLSTVHTSLGEFDLASRALDSYVTIAIKAKARIQKSGEDEPGVDNDDTMVSAISAGIDMLCTFGDRKEAIRAQELASLLGRTIDDTDVSAVPMTPKSPNQAEQEKMSHSNIRVSLSSECLATAHRSIGVSNARWAQLVYDPEKRTHLQAASIKHLRKSLQGGPSNESNLDTLYALGLACAERRDTQGALASVKEALLQTLPSDDSIVSSKKPTPVRANQMFSASTRCWHLLTMLLTSRQDFENAAASCDEALEQFGGDSKAALYPRMTLADKQNLISLRTSHITLKQVLEGTEAAINDSMSLLSLHGELFPERSKQGTASAKSAARLKAPSVGSGGPAFSVRGSILGRNKADRSSQNLAKVESNKSAGGASDPAPRKLPVLSVPKEEDENTRPVTSHSTKSTVSRTPSKRLQKKASRKSVGKQSPPSKKPAATDSGASATSPDNVNKGAATAGASHLEPMLPLDSQVSSDLNGLASPNTLRKFVPCPAVHYAEAEYSRRSNEMLAGIWLFISSLYRRAELYGDSAESLQEAYEQVREIEADVARQDRSSAEEFERAGWGGSRSADELWADLYAERGELRRAQERPLDAMAEFEAALAHFPDHVRATVALANILLDIYSGKVVVPTRPHEILSPADRDDEGGKLPHDPEPASNPVLATVPGDSVSPNGNLDGEDGNEDDADGPQVNGRAGGASNGDIGKKTDDAEQQHVSSNSPEALDRLAARDRAYSLLSTLSKLGTGWDQSEVWFALSRAYEESGQLDKAQEALWWVVELEKKRPIRDWNCLGQGYNLWL